MGEQWESLATQAARLGRVGAWAPGSYLSKCMVCGVQFEGDKRALNCLPCAVIAFALAAEKARPVGDQAAITDIIRRAMLERPGSVGSFDQAAERYAGEIASLARPVGEVPEGWATMDTAPKDGNCVLLWFEPGDGTEPWMDQCYWDDGWVITSECDHDMQRPPGFYTHWMRPKGPRLSAAPSPPEGLGNKGFMADREVEKPTPVASDATPEGWLFVRDELHRMSLVIESAVREAEPEHHPLVLRLIKANTHLVRSAVPDGSPESQEKAPDASLSANPNVETPPAV